VKTLPKSIPGRIRLATLLVLLLLVAAHFRIDRVAAYALSGKQEGDILFQSLPRGELVDAIEGVTGSDWRPHESFIRSMENGRLPLDRLMVTPVSLTRDPQLVRVF